MTTSKVHAVAGGKFVQFSIQSLIFCLIISGSLRLASLIKLSEEDGIQFFGPDNVAIKKVRLIVISTSSLITLVLINDVGHFEHTFYSGTQMKQVIIKLNNINQNLKNQYILNKINKISN